MNSKSSLCRAVFSGICLVTILAAPAHAVALDAADALPVSAGRQRGFLCKSAQSPALYPEANSYLRALQQSHGMLLDNTGNPVPNVAWPGPEKDGAFRVDLVNFSLTTDPVALLLNDELDFVELTPALFPGIPGSTGSVSNFVDEITGFLDLTAGPHIFSIITAITLTAANDDDDYRLFVGTRPRDFFAPLTAQFERRTSFAYPTMTENVFTLDAPTSGLYPFRLLHWQTGWSSLLFFMSVNTNTQERVLLNDASNPRAIRVYSAAEGSHTAEACAGEVSPFPNSAGIKPGAPVKLVLLDGTPKLSDLDVKLFINDVPTQARSTVRDSHRLTLVCSLPVNPAQSNAEVRLEYADVSGHRFTNLWNYVISSGTVPHVTGQWDFDQGDLFATIGQPLEYFDGPDGLTAALTQFGTTEDFGISPIQGEMAHVMQVPGELNRSIGYLMRHGIAPNGGGTLVNQYTILFDIMVASEGAWAASLLQISSTNNLDDGDLFWQDNQFGQGNDGYFGTRIFTPNEWHRVIAAFDMSANPPVVTKYVDGVFQDDWIASQGLDHPRRALLPVAVLFADDDQDERRQMWVNSIQIRSGALTKPQMEALGGPSATGIPLEIPEYHPQGEAILRVELITRLAGSTVRVTWPASHTNYVIETTSNLRHPNWQPVSNATGNSFEFTPEVSQQYFRLRRGIKSELPRDPAAQR